MAHPDAPHLTDENRRLYDLVQARNKTFLLNPELLIPILKPCEVRVLLVTDGILDFSMRDFGLQTFVETLLTHKRYYVRFKITLAHINAVGDDALMKGDARIAGRHKSFRFDNPAHFKPDLYDQVWLFGFDTSYPGRSANGFLADAELKTLTEFMNGGGGLFATGDHGFLGRALCGAVPRARSMRLWAATFNGGGVDEVSMNGPRRNDTNRRGHDTESEFDDQSDDVPQDIQPTIYTRRFGLWKYAFPHPLLCSRRGMIRVLPDHPHEGQCVPGGGYVVDLAKPIDPADPAVLEYPAATAGGPKPEPEAVATSTVIAGIKSGVKADTDAQSFTAISAYNGHRAAVGRVVTDATWHHYVNINLIGQKEDPVNDAPKRFGFLSTPAGQAHLEDIKDYYRNIAVWLARPHQIKCMARRAAWGLLVNDRVMEATMTHTNLPLAQASVNLLFDVGKHARDVLNRFAGQCQSRTFLLELIDPPVLVRPWLNPWDPVIDPPRPDPLPWFDPDPLLDVAWGGVMLALREAFPVATEKVRAEMTDEKLDAAIRRGAQTAITLSLKSLDASVDMSQGRFAKPLAAAVAPK